MDFELRRAREKLEQEQRERKQKAKLKLEREKKAKQEAIRQREAIEAGQRARRLDAAEAQAKVSFAETPFSPIFSLIFDLGIGYLSNLKIVSSWVKDRHLF